VKYFIFIIILFQSFTVLAETKEEARTKLDTATEDFFSAVNKSCQKNISLEVCTCTTTNLKEKFKKSHDREDVMSFLKVNYKDTLRDCFMGGVAPNENEKSS
jgi:hypothetical protein